MMSPSLSEKESLSLWLNSWLVGWLVGWLGWLVLGQNLCWFVHTLSQFNDYDLKSYMIRKISSQLY